MAFTFLALWGLSTVLLGRFLMKRWFNHVSVYSATWGLSLLAYELRWIRYNPITGLAWFYIFVAWISFLLGTVVCYLIVGPTNFGDVKSRTDSFAFPRLETFIWLFCALSAISLFVQARQMGSSLRIRRTT